MAQARAAHPCHRRSELDRRVWLTGAAPRPRRTAPAWSRARLTAVWLKPLSLRPLRAAPAPYSSHVNTSQYQSDLRRRRPNSSRGRHLRASGPGANGAPTVRSPRSRALRARPARGRRIRSEPILSLAEVARNRDPVPSTNPGHPRRLVGRQGGFRLEADCPNWLVAASAMDSLLSRPYQETPSGGRHRPSFPRHGTAWTKGCGLRRHQCH